MVLYFKGKCAHFGPLFATMSICLLLVRSKYNLKGDIDKDNLKGDIEFSKNINALQNHSPFA